MPDQSKVDLITSAVTKIRLAQKALMIANSACDVPLKSNKILAEYNHLDSILSQLLQTLTIADDATFLAAAGSLKDMATVIETEETKLKTIVDDVAAAADVVGYLADAATFIGKL